MSAKHMRYGNHADCEPLHYTACGLDDVYLLSGYELHQTPYGNGVSVTDVDGLHRAIGLHLARDKKVLNGKEIRFLRKQMDLTQAELAELLGVTSQTVARWEKGEFETQAPSELMIRLLYLDCLKLLPETVRQFIKSLVRKDEVQDTRQLFEETAQGWQPRAAA
jgi:DNA-binding transcriptional regulator YiaG